MEVCFIYIVWVADNIYILFDLQGVVDVKGKWGFIKMDVTTNCSMKYEPQMCERSKKLNTNCI